jgi:hypothetical protein
MEQRVSSLKGTGVPSTYCPRCSATEACVISGVIETLTTSKSLVASVIPNRRNDSVIYEVVSVSNSVEGDHLGHTLFVGLRENTISEWRLCDLSGPFL